jgi:hypothetical protein
MRCVVRGEDGFAVIVAMMGLLLISALGTALVLATSVDTMIARNFRDSTAALYADIVAGHGIYDLSTMGDWTPVLAGTTRSGWSDGQPGGVKTLRDGSTIDLTETLTLLNCGRLAGCTGADITATTAARPWGPNNPQWRPFAWGPLARLMPTGVPDSGFYGFLLVADDPAETDGDPLADALDAGHPGAGVLMLRAEVFGPGGAHAAVELTVARTDPVDLAGNPRLLGVRAVSWRAAR